MLRKPAALPHITRQGGHRRCLLYFINHSHTRRTAAEHGKHVHRTLKQRHKQSGSSANGHLEKKALRGCAVASSLAHYTHTHMHTHTYNHTKTYTHIHMYTHILYVLHACRCRVLGGRVIIAGLPLPHDHRPIALEHRCREQRNTRHHCQARSALFGNGGETVVVNLGLVTGC